MMRRRTYLKTVGAVGAIGLLAGCSVFDSGTETPSGSETSTPTPSGGVTGEPETAQRSRFSSVVDVSTIPVDDEGNDPIDAAIENHLENDTLLVFPDGRYKVGTIRKHDVSNVGLVAADGATPTIVPASPIGQLPGDELLVDIKGRDIVMGGFLMDFTRATEYGGRVQLIGLSGNVRCFDMTTHGQLAGYVDGYRVETRDENGVAVMDNVNMRDGSVEGRSASGIFVGPPHAGEVHIRDCDVWHFPSKGIYASNPAHPDVGAGGTVHVDGGIYKNNNDSDIRIGSAGSTVRNVVCIKDDSTEGDTVTWKRPIPLASTGASGEVIEDIVQTRSIRLKYGSDVLVEGCEFVHERGGGAGVITGEGSHNGGTTIRDCRISVNDADIYPILLKQGSNSYTVENVSITGDGGHGAGIRVEGGRDGTEVRNCCLSLTRDGEKGVVVYDADDCVVADSNINVSGEAVVFDGASGETTGLTYTDSCPLPDPSGSAGDSTNSDGTTRKTLSNTCTVRTTGQSVEYTVTVSDGIVDGSNGNVVDSSVANTVSGSLADGEEEWFWFDGEVRALELSADAAFYVNGTEVDPAQYDAGESLPNAVSIDGSASRGGAQYEFAVTGEVERDAEASTAPADAHTWDQSEDSVDGSAVDGQVWDGVDTYRFSGTLSRLKVDGNARVNFE
jgi:hypothetical protein